ncbi:MAG: hypothetical protein H8E66_02575 [Planctomycetes bacterium]|nr:hypothetical protein [Planctomycetota bacterium]
MSDSADIVESNAPTTDVPEERLEFENSFDADATETAATMLPSEKELQWPDLVVAVLALGAWFVLFAGGILIGTAPFRSQIGGSAPLGFAEHAKAWYVVLAFWTVTNIGLIACASALLGAVGRRVGFTTVDAEDVVVRQAAQKQVGLYYGCAIMRGFGVYSLILAGIFVFAQDAASEPEQLHYLSIAPLLSIAGFYAGYDPVLFSGLLARAKKLLNALPI